MKQKFRTNGQNVFDPLLHITMETAHQPSKTVPNQDTDLGEMLRRHSRGEPLEYIKGVYLLDSESDNFDLMQTDIEKMTAMERMDLAKEISEYIADQKFRLQNKKERSKEKTKRNEMATKIVRSLQQLTGLDFSSVEPKRKQDKKADEKPE